MFVLSFVALVLEAIVGKINKKSSTIRHHRRNMKEDSEQTTPPPEAMQDALITMAVESWRFGRVFNRMLPKLDAREQKRYESQFSWFMKKVNESLEQADLKIVNIEGDSFEPGIAATPLNIEEFNVEDDLVVDHMLEPIIMGKKGLVKMGTVTLRKK